MGVTDGLPIRLIVTCLMVGFGLYLIFLVYRKFILPSQLERIDGTVRHALYRKVEIIVWALYILFVLFGLLSYNLLVFGALVIIILFLFKGFWINYFHGVTVVYTGTICEGDDIIVGKSQGRISRFGLQALHLIKTTGEEIIVPYSKLNVPIRIAQKESPDVLMMSVTIQMGALNHPQMRQRIKDIVFANPWIMVNRPIEIVVEQNQVRIRYAALNQEMAELARQRLMKDLSEVDFSVAPKE